MREERPDDTWPDTEAREILARCLVSVGMAGLARCAAYMRPGAIESRVNWELGRSRFRDDKRAWLRLDSAKNVARRIRKPMNELDDYKREAAVCLNLRDRRVMDEILCAGYR